MYSVYIIRHSQEKIVFHVGIAKDFRQRKRQHLRTPQPWLKEMLDSGLPPVFELIYDERTEAVARKEKQQHIQFLKGLGYSIESLDQSIDIDALYGDYDSRKEFGEHDYYDNQAQRFSCFPEEKAQKIQNLFSIGWEYLGIEKWEHDYDIVWETLKAIGVEYPDYDIAVAFLALKINDLNVEGE